LKVFRLALLALLAGGIAVTVGLLSAGSAETGDVPANNILERAVAIELGEAEPTSKADLGTRVSGGVVTATLERMGINPALTQGAGASSVGTSSHESTSGFAPPSRISGTGGCPNRFEGDDDDNPPDNIRVNQDCTLRRQAEEWVGVNPRDFNNVLAGQNDSMVGFNHCGYDWSLSKGEVWGSVGTQPPPFYQELFNTSGDTADACSDPAGTFDHLGNAYVTGVFFEVADVESSIWVAKSNWPIKGRFYHEPREIAFQEYRTAVMGEPASDADPDIFHDKELMVADTRPNSTKRGRIYVTWTRFETTATPVGGRSPIVFSQSTDGGATWSRQVIISGAAGSFCTGFSGTPDSPNACDQDQGSHPAVGPDGTIYVIFGNGNTPELGVNQVLMVKCPPSEDCNDETDWTPPVRIDDLIGTHPIGDPGNAGGCPVGRQCLPPNGYRVPEFTSMTISVDRNNVLYATWADHRDENPAGNCGLRPWSAASPPCDHEVFYAFSLNRGTTWIGPFNITNRFGRTAQWQPWSDVSGDGRRLEVAFYDRHYPDTTQDRHDGDDNGDDDNGDGQTCEFTGCNDITLATIWNPASASLTRPPRITYRKITTSSMPNLVPANNPIQAGFLGDYMWVEVSRHHFAQDDVHIVWGDTRQLFGPAPEEDIYYARIDRDDDDDDD
jgi:hypothetical protein